MTGTPFCRLALAAASTLALAGCLVTPDETVPDPQPVAPGTPPNPAQPSPPHGHTPPAPDGDAGGVEPQEGSPEMTGDLTGTLHYGGPLEGHIVIDAVVVGEPAESAWIGPWVVPRPGPFALDDLPEATVVLQVTLDIDGDGPTEGDPEIRLDRFPLDLSAADATRDVILDLDGQRITDAAGTPLDGPVATVPERPSPPPQPVDPHAGQGAPTDKE